MEYTDNTQIINSLKQRLKTEHNESIKNELNSALWLMSDVQALETMLKEINTYQRKAKSYKTLIYIVQCLLERNYFFKDRERHLEEANQIAIDSYLKIINAKLAEKKRQAELSIENLI